jgi:hypothetical protein
MGKEDAKMNEPTFLVIWKYEVYVNDYLQHLKIPKGATFLAVAMQDDQEHPQVWWLVDPKEEKEIRSFRVVGTGHPTIRQGRDFHLGTFQQPPFVWHLFEVIGGLDGSS